MTSLFTVVVTWNGENCIAKCLHSLLNADIPMQIIVVDNASSDQTVEIVQATCPDAIIFRLTKNLGFGKANNIGIKYAYDQGAQHILLINQDAYVEPDTIGGLIDLQQANPEFGILTPLHLDSTGAKLDRLFCDHVSKASSIRQLLSDMLLKRHPGSLYDVEFINAAVWLLSRECIERVGLFNPAFKHYGEDKEYADRVHFQGLRIGLAPGFRAFHERTQNQSREGVALARYLVEEEALIRYRLSRMVPGTGLNLLSALSRVMLSSYPGNRSRLIKLTARIRLLGALFSCLPIMLRMKKIAYRGGRCFFQDAESDKSHYALPSS